MSTTDRDILYVAAPAIEVRLLGYGSHWEYAGKRYSYDPTIPGERERDKIRFRVQLFLMLVAHPTLGALVGWLVGGHALDGFLLGASLVAFCAAMGLTLVSVVWACRLIQRWWNRGPLRPASDPEA